MIRQLRKKFILVAMCSMIIVLTVIVGILNLVSYTAILQRADRILEMLAENEGRFPGAAFGRKGGPGNFRGPADFRDMPDFFGMPGISEETPYETRFFSVLINGNGEAVLVDTGRIAAVETAEAIAYAQEVYGNGREKGFYGTYRFFNTEVQGSDSRRIVFVDCSKDLSDFWRLVRNGVFVALLGILAVFVPVLFFSGKVFLPVEESYEKQRMFVTDASHELKTPLTIISANVDLLELEGGENQWTASVRNQVERLRKLTGQMVDLSRMDEQQDVDRKEFSLSNAVAETAEGFRAPALELGKTLRSEIEEGIVYPGDEAKLRQMTGLLLDNALKYAGENSEIVLRLESFRKRGSRVRLILTNALGADSGIAPGNQDKLFERFYRPDASRSSATGGSGIGLSIVKSIVELHGGKVRAESADGKSIRFIVVL